jgi:hypothetical protein
MKTPFTKRSKAFSLLETSLLLASVAGLYMYFTPLHKTLNTQAVEAQKTKITSEIETAKNKFDQDASPKDKEAFNNGDEKERFAKLAPYLKTSSSEQYFRGSGIENCRINAIGTNSQVQ